MDIACDAVILFAERHADAGRRELAAREPTRPAARSCEKIAEVCRRVPAHAPRDFHEALQCYWFCHLAVITELNGWDSFNPGHLDQHLLPFYERGLADGTLTREARARAARVLLRQVQQPPGAAEGRRHRGRERHLHRLRQHQPRRPARDGSTARTRSRTSCSTSSTRCTCCSRARNIQLSRKTPDAVLKHALRVVRKGYGFPSLFNADAVVEEQLRQGKTLEDARAGGCSGCVEVGRLRQGGLHPHRLLQPAEVLELALHDGVDPRTGKQLGPRTGRRRRRFAHASTTCSPPSRRSCATSSTSRSRGNQLIERMYATRMPAPFLSVLIDDCIAQGPRLQRRRRPLQQHLHPGRRHRQPHRQPRRDPAARLRREAPAASPTSSRALDADFAGQEPLRQRLVNRTPKYGNDDD